MGRPVPGRRGSPGTGAGRPIPGRRGGAGRGVPRGAQRGGGGGSAERQSLADAGKTHMIIGGVVCLIGIAITAITYANASSKEGGGTYIVWWGAIVFGAIDFFRGLMIWQKHK